MKTKAKAKAEKVLSAPQTPHLFLGFPIGPAFEAKLAQVNPSTLALFTQGGDTYLELCETADARYLGKDLGALSDLATLELMESNIYSLLKHLVPEYPYAHHPLVLTIRC